MSDTEKKTLSVREIAKKCRVSERQIQRLAKEGKVPGAELKVDGYHTAYHDNLAFREWIKDRRSKRKGKLPDGRRKAKKKGDLSAVSFPDRSLRKWKASLLAVCKTEPFEGWKIEELLALSFRLETAMEVYVEVETILHFELSSEVFSRPDLVAQNEFSPFTERFRELKDFLRKFIGDKKMRKDKLLMPHWNEWDAFFRASEQRWKRKRKG